VNHQESEPNYYIDKWLGHERADELGQLFDALLDRALDAIVIGAKERDPWMGPLETATDATMCEPSDIPLDPGPSRESSSRTPRISTGTGWRASSFGWLSAW
jgi:hypothetical protein